MQTFKNEELTLIKMNTGFELNLVKTIVSLEKDLLHTEDHRMVKEINKVLDKLKKMTEEEFQNIDLSKALEIPMDSQE